METNKRRDKWILDDTENTRKRSCEDGAMGIKDNEESQLKVLEHQLTQFKKEVNYRTHIFLTKFKL